MLDDVAERMQIAPDFEFIRYAVDAAAILAITDQRGRITYVNDKFCEISGYSAEELVDSNHRILKSGKHDRFYFRSMYRRIVHGKIWHGEICNRRKDGSFYWVYTTIVPHIGANGKVDRYVSIRFDITERKELEEELRASKANLKRIADVDPQTGLLNRRRFQEHVGKLVDRHGKGGFEFYLGLVDIDMFKDVNDMFGHPAGDDLLVTVATRLRSVGGASTFAFRLGGDEFGLIVVGGSAEDARIIFEEALEAIRHPVLIAGVSRHCSASLGVAAFPRDGSDAAALLSAADMALYHAKSLGRDRVELFTKALRDSAEQRSTRLVEIEEGLKQEAFELHYQPIVPLKSGRPVCLEALMRWQHPKRGLLLPASFRDGFDDQRLRAAFGEYLLEHVFRDIAYFDAIGIPLGRVAFNVTNSDFRSTRFPDRFFELTDETGIAVERFCAEVTEGMFLGVGQQRVLDGLRRMHNAGVEIALDDFGTGFASLTHLRQLPIDRLKIDRSFTANMVTCKEDRAIIHGVIDIAHSLGAIVTAEGVETVEQLEILSDMGCDMVQGWYFAKACRAGELRAVLDAMPRFLPPPPDRHFLGGARAARGGAS